ncbi:unnamed protein product [Ectocarpus sp. 12 AP-2014]
MECGSRSPQKRMLDCYPILLPLLPCGRRNTCQLTTPCRPPSFFLQGILELILETLQLCIGELHAMPQPLLDTILIQLLPVTKKENPTSYNLAAELLNVTLAKVQTPISHLVSSMLSGARGGAIESELKEHVIPLVFELHKVTPNMLTFILPEVAEQLKAEDVDVS